jgi:hypothetical protein
MVGFDGAATNGMPSLKSVFMWKLIDHSETTSLGQTPFLAACSDIHLIQVREFLSK